MLADELLADPVELAGGHAGLDVLADERDRLGDELARARHSVDLLRGLSDDHRVTATCSNACWISANTSFSVRLPWIGTRLPRVR